MVWFWEGFIVCWADVDQALCASRSEDSLPCPWNTILVSVIEPGLSIPILDLHQ